ncbi:nutrient amino acid transporter 1-like [Hyalella azteca]|nr:nutrient amino acid transporter 1-like [Hyalella azteca]
MSVGLGNIWRFPFVAYENGGGAFLIPYLCVLIFIGKPLYYMELCLGQFASAGAVKVWQLAPAFKGVGYGQALATWSVVTYYVSLMALTVFYFFASFSSVLPWSECGEGWSTKYCVRSSSNHSLLTFNVSLAKSSSEEYFINEVLRSDPSGLDNGMSAPEWRLSLCLLFSWLLIFLVLVKGVASSGKVAYFTALFPYLVLFILLGRGATLPGAVDGIIYFLKPQWEKLLEVKVWYAALSQSFFSLSVGFGSIIMFASYNDFRHNVYRDATIISYTDTFTSILAGLTIFSILGYLANELGVDVKDVLKGGGSTLAFVSYPDVLSRFTFAPQFFATLFFLMLFTLGIGSATALTGCVITIICDEFPRWKKWLVTLCVCIVGYLMGLVYVTPQGQYVLTLIDYYGGGFLIFILAALEVIAVHWVYGIKRFCLDIEFMLNRKTSYYWKFCWAILIPVVLIVVFFYTVATSEALTHGKYVFGPGAIGFGVALTLFAVSTVPALFLYAYVKRYRKGMGLLESVKDTFRPSDKWGPRDPVLNRNYKDFLAGNNPAVPMDGIDNPASDIEIHRF